MTDAILIIQTAFAGDLILTTPLIEEAAAMFPGAAIDMLCIPSTAPLLENHPQLRRCIVYDKKNGNPSLPTLMRILRKQRYSLCLSPHRSMRSALLARATQAPRRIAFDRSAAPWLFTETVRYEQGWHEVDRVRSLLHHGKQPESGRYRPRLFPSTQDRSASEALQQHVSGGAYVCIAPGSVWATKRWIEEGFVEVLRYFAATRTVFLLGGSEDRDLCEVIAQRAGIDILHGSTAEAAPDGSREGVSEGARGRIVNTAGDLGFLASAALIEGAGVLISNDSAPVHLASAMGTPVVEIYGATVPAYGFTPFGVPHRIVQREDLDCRPCAIHGGNECPIHTFACMKGLEARFVIEAAEELLNG
ncbi:MAG: glycosyltransferase family 9 protein [Bacteroidetes bacterium]|nr:glycosyltransferase family 9 protein [Bacteroidota bacterium]